MEVLTAFIRESSRELPSRQLMKTQVLTRPGAGRARTCKRGRASAVTVIGRRDRTYAPGDFMVERRPGETIWQRYGPDLTGANLADAYLADADLSCGNLAGANLSGALLVGANL